MKPIVRWTIGAVKPAGFRCLLHSFKSFQKLYGSDFEYYVLYNRHQPIIEANLLDQRNFGMKDQPKGAAWKLCPPRLDMNTSEIFIDNDLVLFKRLPEIDLLLNEGIPFMTEGLRRNFGKYDLLVGRRYILNSGLFGLPIGFDFEGLINKTNNNWGNYYDEQGLVAYVMTSFKKFNIIPRSKVGICRPEDQLPNATHGLHFCGLNFSLNHNGWTKFTYQKRRTIKLD